MKTIVIYHAGCWDGFCAAWLFSKQFPDAAFIPAHYGEAPPDVTGCHVFILDFSYKRPVMLDIVAAAATVTVLDHHESAETELAGLASECNEKFGKIPNIIFKMDRSGGRLAWEYLHCGASPWLVDYTEDRDLWRHELPQSKFINAAIRSYPLGFQVWDIFAGIEIGSEGWTALTVSGEAILRREKQIVDDHVRHAKPMEIGDHSVLCVNATVLFSEIAGKLAEGEPFGACYFIRGDEKAVFSLRSSPDGINVSEVAKQYGGGGHRNAAGFQIHFNNFKL